MKTTHIMSSLAAIGLIASIPSAFAAGGMLKACKKELKKYDCAATHEADAFKCLEQHEADGKKYDGFSKRCYEAHESYERKMNKEEKGEAHEAPEHGE